MAASTAYSNSLLSKRRGFPLYIPEQSANIDRLGGDDDGLRVGDIGMITPYGYFDLLFNVYAAGNDPVNAHGRPEALPLSLLNESDVVTESHPKMTFSGTYVDATDGHSVNQDATLVLPNGYTSHDLRDTSTLKDTLLSHGHSWYKYATSERGRSANGPLYVITGVDKTNSWKIAANSSQSQVAQSNVGDGGGVEMTTKWSSYSSPGFRVSTAPADGPLSQCVFFRAFAVTARPEELENDDDGDDDGVDLVLVGDHSAPPHPLAKINSALLAATPEATAAVTHDGDWYRLLRAEEPLPSDDELVQRLGRRYRFTLRDEIVTLSDE